jgi:cytochrome c
MVSSNISLNLINKENAMKSVILTLLLVTTSAWASPELAKTKNCMACHAVDKKLVGPSFKEISARYAKDANAVDNLAKKVRSGGSGVWGPMPMPANPQVSEAEAKTLVQWILKQK